jgi:CheY-like chemotaxis protein
VNERLTISSKKLTSSKSILILDDEDDVVSIFRKSLELGGYSVFGFTDQWLSLEHFRNNSDKYGLVLTDFSMPLMSGIEFAAHIRTISRTVKILIMSAFEVKDLDIAPSLQIAGVLQKPLSLKQLQGAVLENMTVTGTLNEHWNFSLKRGAYDSTSSDISLI